MVGFTRYRGAVARRHLATRYANRFPEYRFCSFESRRVDGALHDCGSQDGASPLFIAAQNGHLEVCGALLRAGAAVDAARGDGASPLWIAAQCGHDHVARELLRRGAAADRLRRCGATPLFKAAHKGHAAVVAELLRHAPALGLLPNGQSALHGAAACGRLACVRLLARRSGLRLRNAAGLTPLQAARAARQADVVAYLERLERQEQPESERP